MEEITTKEAFVKEMQDQLVEMAKEQKEDKVAAYDILKVCQTINEENIGESKVWETLSGKKEIRVKQSEPKKELPAEVPEETQLISLEPAKRTIFDRLRDRFGKKDGTSVYTFGKFNEKTGQYENIRVEQHCFPPRGIFFKKRCQKDCIGLKINNPIDRPVLLMEEIAENMPNLQSLIFGKNVEMIAKRIEYTATNLKSLNEVEFLDDVEVLDTGLFIGCENLTNVKFGKNIKEIGDAVFARCSKLENVKLPEGLSKIGKGAFNSLENNIDSAIHIPLNIISQCGKAFCKRCVFGN